ncbi:protein kinase [Streptomyces sp. M2CJ-2]|uniref:serine/threonine-protein kinase n=1 Tax=Streptomyces sp. M2CJ-2 TaxID=2803948 RepID=UPI001922E883|nr:serine/threonine-protein kinase [Streptomyces sp. M2CJ-2]MBL3665046.1 protein kinase [Streptomyces sp. M2CJ-2]
MGEVFAGRYELVDPIGRGGVGAVWRAWDHRRRRYVAAKVLLQSDAHSLLRFVREQALRIDHPHVLAPSSWAADDDQVLFTMDLVAGGSLVHLIGDYGPLPPAFVGVLLDQLLAGLTAVHTEGVVHRDIKPANLLLEATGTGRPRLRVSDFGIAMRLGEPRLTETDLVVGTPGYLAPEQLMGSEPDFPADLFAVGLVALYLLEGAKPDAKALIQHFAEHGTPGAPQGIPDPLWQVVATLLQPDPQARFRTSTGARKALAAARELLPAPGPDDELIEIFDQLGPLPPGFGPEGPLKAASGVRSAPNPPGGVGQHPESGETDRPPGVGAAGALLGASGRGDSPSRSEPGHGGTSSHGGGVDRQVPASRPTATGVAGTGPAPAAPPRQPSMSDTGSFHLPPPQATVTSSPAPARPPHAHTPPDQGQGRVPEQVHVREQSQGSTPSQPPHDVRQVTHADRTHPLRSPLFPPSFPPSACPGPASHRADASTAEYTARVPQAPSSGRAVSRHGATGRRRRRRRPGPPARVVVPLLLLALTCYAVGFWALMRI